MQTVKDRPFRTSSEERRDMIAVAAYFLSERRGFLPGRAEDDWLIAETQIDQMLEETDGGNLAGNRPPSPLIPNALRKR